MQGLARDLFAKTKLAMNNEEDALEEREARARPAKLEPTIVQSEGWLMFRRGPGAESAFSVPPSPRNTVASEDEDAPLSLFAPMSQPSSRLGSMVAYLKGTDENKRYCVLLTTRATVHSRRKATATDGSAAELRYFRQKPSPPDNFSNPLGVVHLAHNMDVQVQDTTIKLSSPERSYYLRYHDPSEINPVRAKTSASQWLNALQFAIGGLATVADKRKTGGRFQPISTSTTPTTIHSSSINHELPVEFETRRKARKSVGRRGDESEGEDGSLDPFVDLWEMYGVNAFDAVVNHFGLVQTDLERLRAHFQSRSAQFAAEAQVLQTQLGNSSEVVVKEQKTVAFAIRELHKTNERTLVMVKEAAREIDREVLDPLTSLLEEISTGLEQIASRYATPVSYMQGAVKLVKEADDRVTRLTNLSSNAVKPLISRRKSEAAPEKLEFDLNEARQAKRDALQNLVAIETKCAEPITEAMIALYKLEQRRFRVMGEILETASDLETTLDTKRAVETPLERALHSIDAQRDMRSTFAKLKVMGEKTRPGGRMRRKNSAVNRAINDLLLEEEEDGDGDHDGNHDGDNENGSGAPLPELLHL
ncbi:hypothetical protein BASA81_001453 [Batrachochytrium salamandrivorans]|nr:hypothetical protein BASA81_001453 [Batrachochytrium salamandrivorans]